MLVLASHFLHKPALFQTYPNMSENTDTKLNPAEQDAESNQPKLAKDETEKVTSKVTEDTAADKKENTSTSEGMASLTTDKAASGGTGMKDNMFSMFGGGAKKEKKEEDDAGADEPSGSSKKKDGEVGLRRISLRPTYGSSTSLSLCFQGRGRISRYDIYGRTGFLRRLLGHQSLTHLTFRRKKRSNRAKTSTSSPWYT